MPTLHFNKDFVFERLKEKGIKLDLDGFKQILSEIGIDLKEINDNEIIAEIFPNRPDMFSMNGFINAIITYKTGILKEFIINNSNYKLYIDESNEKIRPYTACAVVKDLELDDEKIKEIIQLQEKYHDNLARNRKKFAIGIYPLDKIEFPIYFKALKPEEIRFKPLNSNKVMNGHEILEEHETGIKYKELLKDFDKYPVFIDSNNNILSMPPIINSEETGRITINTKNVFIECSGSDLNLLKTVLNNIIIDLIGYGGKVYNIDVIKKIKNKETSKNKEVKQKEITYKTPDLRFIRREVNTKYLKYLGLELNKKQINNSLNKMNLRLIDYNKDKLIIEYPNYRFDFLHDIDFIDEIAIGYGYNNFREEPSNLNTIAKSQRLNQIYDNLKEIILGLKFNEVLNYHLYNKEKNMIFNKNPIELSNSVSSEFNILRTNILPLLLETLSKNSSYSYPQRFFEIGRVFYYSKNKSRYSTPIKSMIYEKDIKDNKDKIKEYSYLNETNNLSLIIASNNANYTSIKEVFDNLMNILKNSKEFDIDINLKEDNYEFLIEGRSASILNKNKVIGFIGELHPKVILNYKLEIPVACLEINLDELLKK